MVGLKLNDRKCFTQNIVNLWTSLFQSSVNDVTLIKAKEEIDVFLFLSAVEGYGEPALR